MVVVLCVFSCEKEGQLCRDYGPPFFVPLFDVSLSEHDIEMRGLGACMYVYVSVCTRARVCVCV